MTGRAEARIGTLEHDAQQLRTYLQEHQQAVAVLRAEKQDGIQVRAHQWRGEAGATWAIALHLREQLGAAREMASREHMDAAMGPICWTRPSTRTCARTRVTELPTKRPATEATEAPRQRRRQAQEAVALAGLNILGIICRATASGPAIERSGITFASNRTF